MAAEITQEAHGLTAEQALYFAMLADLGHTKHIGGRSATAGIIAAIAPGPADALLDIGCGVGVTAVFLAEQFGCHVTGVDITPGMLAHAEQRAAEHGVAARTAFKAADMLALPFTAGSFDAVLAESVLSFAVDKTAVLAEIGRVLRPGGRLAFTEAVWVKPPPPEMAAALSRAAGLPAGLLAHEQWLDLLGAGGWAEVAGEEHGVNAKQEARDQSGRLGAGDYWRILRNFGGVLGDARYRRLYREALRGFKPEHAQYIGYGVYSAVKPGVASA